MRVAIRHTTHYTLRRGSARSPSSGCASRPSTTRRRRSSPGRSRRTASRDAADYVDGFGNRVHLITHCKPYDELTIIASGEVETVDSGGVVGNLGETANPLLFLRPTPLHAVLAGHRRAEPTGCQAPGCSTGCTICWRRSPAASPTSPTRRSRRRAPPRRSRRGRGSARTTPTSSSPPPAGSAFRPAT